MINHNVVIGLNEEQEVSLSFKNRLNNSICVGPVASGKYSQLIKPLINQDITNRDISVITIESNNQTCRDVYNLCNYHNRKVTIFDPAIKDKSVRFNPLKENNDNCKKILLDALNSENKDDNFYNKLIDNSLYILKNVYKDKSNLLDFYYLISNQNNNGALIIKDFFKEYSSINTLTTDLEIANWFLNTYYKDLKEYSKSILLRNKIEALISNEYAKYILVLDRETKNTLDIETIIRNKDVLSISTGYEFFDESSLFLENMLFSYVSISLNKSEILNKNDNVSLYIQEPKETIINTLENVLENNSKVNLSTMIGLENLDKLLNQSSDLGSNNSILDMCANNFVFPAISKETANYYLELLKSSEEFNNNDDVRYMKFGEMLYIDKNKDSYHKKLKIKYISRFLDDYLTEFYNDYIF